MHVDAIFGAIGRFAVRFSRFDLRPFVQASRSQSRKGNASCG